MTTMIIQNNSKILERSIYTFFCTNFEFNIAVFHLPWDLTLRFLHFKNIGLFRQKYDLQGI